MNSGGQVVYFLAVIIILVFAIAFIWFLLSYDYASPASDIKALNTGLYLGVRTFAGKSLLTADNIKDSFYATWNIVYDTSGTGTVSFRNAFDGNWIYYTPDIDGKADYITSSLTVRQNATVDPIGWFLIREGLSLGSVSFESYQTSGLFLSVISDPDTAKLLLGITETQDSFLLST